MDALKRAELELQKELNKQVTLNNSSLALALFRNYGWGLTRITNLLERSGRAWEQCADTNEKSMLQMLEDETGIEIKNAVNGQSWHDLAYLNGAIHMDPKDMTRAQWIYMRQKQKTWVPAQVVACLLLALHRRCGWGTTRCQNILIQMDEIKQEYSYDVKKLKEACQKEVGLILKNVC